MKPISYQPGDILRETMIEIRATLGDAMAGVTVERVVVGLFFTGVKLSSGAGGLCFTPVKAIPEAVCCPSSAKVMPTSGKLSGRKAQEFVDEMFGGNQLKKTIGIAAMNAFSMMCWTQRPPADYLIKTGVDAIDELTIPDHAYVVVVGAIIPVLKALKSRGEPFGILELDTSTLKPDEMKYYISPERAHEEIPRADLLIITGTTLINDTLEDMLRMKKPDAQAVVMGQPRACSPMPFSGAGSALWEASWWMTPIGFSM